MLNRMILEYILEVDLFDGWRAVHHRVDRTLTSPNNSTDVGRTLVDTAVYLHVEHCLPPVGPVLLQYFLVDLDVVFLLLWMPNEEPSFQDLGGNNFLVLDGPSGFLEHGLETGIDMSKTWRGY